MCGIAGLTAAPDQIGGNRLHETIAAMTAALAHRGPDDGDLWQDTAAGVALGHRRLSIIDLSPLGRQPMASASGRYVLTYNGEVYNFAALREELQALGHRFRGGSDTEVILAAMEAWGVARAVDRLDGMFAFAVWDGAERRLTLCRDRLGIKPLYWAELGGGIAFASEARSFLGHPHFSPRLDADAVARYLRLNCVPAPLSIWQGVRKLPPGCRLDWQAGAAPQVTRYWSLAEAAATETPPAEIGAAEERLTELLTRAVRGCLISDVPLGAFLSGGIDSSLVAALMRQAGGGPLKTFTIGYAEAGYDESAAAAAVARHLGAEHTALTVTAADALAVIPQLPALYDEPFADASQIPTYLVSKLTRRHVTVALSGDGGDEGFAGYNRHVAAPRWERFRAWPMGLRRAMAALLDAPGPATWDAVAGLLPQRIPQLGEKIAKLSGALTAGSVDAYYRPLLEQWPDAALLLRHPAPAPPFAEQRPGEDLVAYLQRLDADGYLHDDVLTKVDRASMAVGLEARVPLLDHRVVAFGLALPRAMKIRGGGKYLLRRLLAKHVPPALFERPKSGFAVPIGAWLRGPLRDWAEAHLSEAALAQTGLLNPAPIRAAWAEHLSGRRNRQYGLWGVLMLQAWHRHWLKA